MTQRVGFGAAAIACAFAAALFLVTQGARRDRPAGDTGGVGTRAGEGASAGPGAGLPGGAPRSPPPASTTSTSPGVTGGPVDPVGAPAVESPPPGERPPFPERLARAAERGTKHDFRDLLADWRAGGLTADEDRAIDDLVGAVRSTELDTAAGQLLLEARVPAQQQGLAALLAASGSETAIGYLVHASQDPARSALACEALATVSEPGALPALLQAAAGASDPALLGAIASVARNVDTPKARDLERLVAERLGGR